MEITPVYIKVFRAETSNFSRPQPRVKGRFKKQLLVNWAVVKQPLDFANAQSPPYDGWSQPVKSDKLSENLRNGGRG
jgi:hypothetical protein